jgi:hypothetical protein
MSEHPLERVEKERRDELLNPYTLEVIDQFDDEYTTIPTTHPPYITSEEDPILTPQEAAKQIFYFGEDDDDEYPNNSE